MEEVLDEEKANPAENGHDEVEEKEEPAKGGTKFPSPFPQSPKSSEGFKELH